MYSEDERKHYHEVLDSILDLSELNNPDNKNFNECSPDNKLHCTTAVTTLMISKLNTLSDIVKNEVNRLYENLTHYYEMINLNEKEERIYHKLKSQIPKLDIKKFPSREKLFHGLKDKLYPIELERNFIAYCIETGAPIPNEHVNNLVEALRGLNEGQRNYLFEPSKTRKWRNNITAIKQLKFMAICHISILMGEKEDLKKYKAIQIVSEEYGCSEDTIRQWEKRDILETYPKDFLKKIAPLLIHIGKKRAWLVSGPNRDDLPPFTYNDITDTDDDGRERTEYLSHFFIGSKEYNLKNCGILYMQVLRQQEFDFSNTIPDFSKLISVMFELTNTTNNDFFDLEEKINRYR